MKDVSIWVLLITNAFSFLCGGCAFRASHYREALREIERQLNEQGLTLKEVKQK